MKSRGIYFTFILLSGIIIYAFTFVFCLSAVAFAAMPADASISTDISISGSVSKSEIFIGDEIEYEIKVVHPEGITIEMPPFASNLGAFEIKDYKRPIPEKENGVVIERVRYLISTFTTGKYMIPSISVYYEGLGSEKTELKSDPIDITVKSVAADGDEMKEIKGLKSGIEIPFYKSNTLYYIIAFALVIILILIWIIRKKSDEIEIIEEIVIEPQEEALDALDKLMASGLVEKMRYREFYYELSEILRRYLSGIHNLLSMDQVTDEMLDSLRNVSGLPKDEIHGLRDMMIDFDMVKFAKDLRSQEACSEAIKRVSDYVESSKRFWPVNQEEKNHVKNNVREEAGA